MPIQAFVDESGGKGVSRHFVMVGLVGHSDAWAAFSDEWKFALRQSPAIRIFKMREAASCSGQFYGMTGAQRDAKLRMLAQIINRHARLVTYSIIDLNAHAETWARTTEKPQNDPYFWPFHNTIMATCFSLWDIGWREKFEIIYDVNAPSGPRAKIWYPIMQTVCQQREPEASALLPVDPLFRTDDEFLPIQAADMFAWCFRKSTDDPTYEAFNWLLSELKSVELSEYSQYYDKERMQDVTNESYRMLREGLASAEVVKHYQEILKQPR